jgi:tetratricopeptide (TPR) repeat protein
MQQSIGFSIRQMRREQSLTQSELGGEHFSKSYVSAVERGKITPSSEALVFFAEQLGQSSDYFSSLLKQLEKEQTVMAPALPPSNTSLMLNELASLEEVALLDALLKHTDYQEVQVPNDFLNLSPEALALFPPQKQARYYLLRGLLYRQKGEYTEAIQALEIALALSPASHHVTILRELGLNYYYLHVYQTALMYHLRAIQQLREGEVEVVSLMERDTNLQWFRLELCCGNDYLALGSFEDALHHFELARKHMNAQHNMKSAAQLYWGLGYSSYAIVFRYMVSDAPNKANGTFPTSETIEKRLQEAISYLHQSRSVYQISGDSGAEARIRLTLAMVLLDLCSWRSLQADKNRAGKSGEVHANIAAPLNDVEEQCHQILFSREVQPFSLPSSVVDEAAAVFLAAAYLMRVYLQRAAMARGQNYMETAQRERAVALYLCKNAIDALAQGAFPEGLVRAAMRPIEDPLNYQFPSLPRLPELSQPGTSLWPDPLCVMEVYFAAGELTEELGRASTSLDYARSCYESADSWFQAALNAAQQLHAQQKYDFGYVLRTYQRYIAILEQRLQVVPESEDTTQVVIATLKRGFFQLDTHFFLVGKSVTEHLSIP